MESNVVQSKHKCVKITIKTKGGGRAVIKRPREILRKIVILKIHKLQY